MATAFTFGSFGDILALTSLVITCARSLSDSTGSASDFQDFIDELQLLKEDLDAAKALLDAAMNNAGTSPSVSAVATYSPRAIEQCHSAMKAFHKCVEKYGERLNGKGPRSWFYKISWAMWKKDQITDFRGKLGGHRQSIMTLLLKLQSEQLRRIESATDMPPSVKNTIANSIQLVDAIGTRTLIHIEYCSTWKILDGLLKARFGDAPFGRFVQEGEYNMSTHDGKQIILPREWRKVVQAGMVVEMGVILRKPITHSRRKICPICGYVNSEASPRKGWIDCLGLDCNARFQTSTLDENETNRDIQIYNSKS
ncbi:hypothetical protein BD410DRAFT_847193 [Rickenella mellea]|uniref:Ubiquitin-like domain-containing protein n=1 Tax=Rickenella mellea TaxID=50990 RepID=A0A4Y7PD92_9AGAM|nr:hypothetical protein BD410DRAFT_847193 [Rickenella mellea]